MPDVISTAIVVIPPPVIVKAPNPANPVPNESITLPNTMSTRPIIESNVFAELITTSIVPPVGHDDNKNIQQLLANSHTLIKDYYKDCCMGPKRILLNESFISCFRYLYSSIPYVVYIFHSNH